MSEKHTRRHPRFQIAMPIAMSNALRKQADEEGIGYTTLIRRILREHITTVVAAQRRQRHQPPPPEDHDKDKAEDVAGRA